jgi:hypothetical protein
VRPAMLLLLRALVIVGAVLAVISCRDALAAPAGSGDALFEGAPTAENCGLDVMSSWESVPAAGGTISNSGAGTCL